MRMEQRQLDAAAATALRSQISDYESLMLNYSEDLLHIVSRAAILCIYSSKRFSSWTARWQPSLIALKYAPTK